MTDLMGLYSSWSRPSANKQISPTPLRCDVGLSSPIPIPHRQSVHPPPCSPTRGQDSPELVFNLDFSISPDGSNATTHVLRQHRGASVRRPPRQKATYAPLALLNTNDQNVAHPYAHEPFLYPIPGGIRIHKSGFEVNHAPAKEQIAPIPPPASIHSALSLSSLSSHSFNPSCPPSADVSCQLGAEGDSSLASTFQESAVYSITSPPVSFEDIEHPLSPSSPHRTPSSSLHLMCSDKRDQRTILYRRLTSHRTATAAPIVSLSIAQAERWDRARSKGGGGRSRSPGSGRIPSRTRRSSSASTRLGLEKFRESSRQMGTVIGRGAGRVISMFEYGYAAARPLVSDEDIEGSLEKDQVGRSRGIDRGRRRGEEHEKEYNLQGCSNEGLERGRVRARVSAQGSPPGAPSAYVLPGWQRMDTL